MTTKLLGLRFIAALTKQRREFRRFCRKTASSSEYALKTKYALKTMPDVERLSR
ncbi:hypothetical protein RRSWK_06788 [Rhodopirellula sp. SWK7]|nr:hypothetical protein RRSWK_06788 [Rhodopirellula sp. SWK7]